MGLFSGPIFSGTGVFGGGAQQNDPQSAAQLAMMAQLLQGGGYSTQRQSFGQIMGQALLAGQAARQQAQQLQAAKDAAELDKQYKQAQIQKLQAGDESLVSVIDPATGKPTLMRRADAVGQTPYTDPANAPSNVTEAEWYANASPELRAIYDKQNGRKQNPYFQWVQRVLPDGSTQQGVFNARSGETQWDQKIVPPGQKPRVDATGKAEGEAVGGQAAKVPAQASFNAAVQNMRQSIGQTMQGMVSGPLGTAFDYGDKKLFNSRREQLSTELRTVFRIPGEGTLSDQEQRQYGLQLPDTSNPPEVNDQILKDIEQRVALRMQTPIPESMNQAPPKTPAKKLIYDPSTGTFK